MADEKDTAAADSQTILDEYQRIWGVTSSPPRPRRENVAARGSQRPWQSLTDERDSHRPADEARTNILTRPTVRALVATNKHSQTSTTNFIPDSQEPVRPRAPKSSLARFFDEQEGRGSATKADTSQRGRGDASRNQPISSAPPRMMEVSQSPTQTNEDRSYEQYDPSSSLQHAKVAEPLSTAENDARVDGSEDSPILDRTLNENDTGFVNFDPVSQIYSQISNPESSQDPLPEPDLELEPGLELAEPLPESEPNDHVFHPPETPAVAHNPFKANPKITAQLLAGSQLFRQTQYSSAVKQFSPTSSRPSPHNFGNDISPNQIISSPLKNRGLGTSPGMQTATSPSSKIHGLRTSSPVADTGVSSPSRNADPPTSPRQDVRLQPTSEPALPATSPRLVDFEIPHDEIPGKDATIPDSPEEIQGEDGSPRQNAAHTIPGKETAQWSSGQVAQPLEDSGDDFSTDEEVQRKRLVKKRREKALKHLESIVIRRDDDVVEVPSSSKRNTMSRITRRRNTQLKIQPESEDRRAVTIADSQEPRPSGATTRRESVVLGSDSPIRGSYVQAAVSCSEEAPEEAEEAPVASDETNKEAVPETSPLQRITPQAENVPLVTFSSPEADEPEPGSSDLPLVRHAFVAGPVAAQARPVDADDEVGSDAHKIAVQDSNEPLKPKRAARQYGKQSNRNKRRQRIVSSPALAQETTGRVEVAETPLPRPAPVLGTDRPESSLAQPKTAKENPHGSMAVPSEGSEGVVPLLPPPTRRSTRTKPRAEIPTTADDPLPTGSTAPVAETPNKEGPNVSVLPANSSERSARATTPIPSGKTSPSEAGPSTAQTTPNSGRGDTASPAAKAGRRKAAPSAKTRPSVAEAGPTDIAPRPVRQTRRSTRRNSTPVGDLFAPVVQTKDDNKRAPRAQAKPRVDHDTLRAMRDGKLFYGMVFAVSFQSRQPRESEAQYKERTASGLALEKQIHQAGGRIVATGFDELFEVPKVRASEAAPPSSPSQKDRTLRLAPSARATGFTALIADGHSRKVKYMQALALGLPCLHHRWVADCLSKNDILPWARYLLCAGNSTFLDQAIISRSLAPYPAETAQLESMVEHRPMLLDGSSILLLMKQKGRFEEKRAQYIFLAHVLGAELLRVATVTEARAKLKEREKQGGPFEWIYMDDASAEADEMAIFGVAGAASAPPAPAPSRKRKARNSAADQEVVSSEPPPKKVRTLTDELVVQSLILGELIDE